MPQQHITSEKTINRRSFLQQSLTVPVAFLIAACTGSVSNTGSAGQTAASPQASTGARSTTRTSTPVCSGTPTPSQTEGPYYKPGSPERTSLREPGLAGTPLTLTGYVFSTACQPIAHALLDFWHADSNGNYDNAGFKLRGHQFTDKQGHYHLETIVPGEYPGRTRHIHVKVQAPGQPVLTTQLYFPGESGNTSDSIFSPQLLMQVQSTPNGQLATFDFVLALQ
jgi:protocatechuate 3,4-dioxygenase beta subunit